MTYYELTEEEREEDAARALDHAAREAWRKIREELATVTAERDDLAGIVRSLANGPLLWAPAVAGPHGQGYCCPLCRAVASGGAEVLHTETCPRRLAKEWVAQHPEVGK